MRNPFKKLFRTECVYAGPEQMGNKKKDYAVGGVYAGPEQMGAVKKDYDMREVYAGPEEMSGEINEYKAEAIYACPMEVSEIEETSEQERSYPMNNAEPINEFSGVYAAPSVTSSVDTFETRMVYAAPEKRSGDVFSFIPIGGDYCRCGKKFAEGEKFCTNCGAKREEQ